MKKIAVLIGVFMFGLGKAQADTLKVGSMAPDFTLAASDGSQVHLKEWLSKAPIVLYFYPKDDTPGCTKEACGLRDDWAAFRNLNATVFGVSYDTVESHKAFIAKYKLPFLLLADTEKTVAKAYGADGLLFAKRMSFVIDKAGRIAYINPSVSPSTHSHEMQDVLTRLK